MVFSGHFDDEPNVPGFVNSKLCSDLYPHVPLSEVFRMKTNFASIDKIKYKKKIVQVMS